MKEHQTKITGILLAGGQSRRMGRDKGMIRIGKLLMYQYPLKVLESLCNEILISTCNPMEIEEEYEQVCDKIPGIGPIGGVVTCLERSSNDLNIILSYDLPLVNRELFIELLKYSSPFDVILPAASPGRPEPLCGIYRKSAATSLQQMIDQGIFAMHKLIPRVSAKILPVGGSDPFYHDRLFKNINSESDLSGLPDQLL
ncbi:MAG: molybdenum cofactor guanylyltransferase [Bacteroidales bacterium]|nr:molybdenum cofactor guanylyltransferase [Bacteroidales bacterium]